MRVVNISPPEIKLNEKECFQHCISNIEWCRINIVKLFLEIWLSLSPPPPPAPSKGGFYDMANRQPGDWADTIFCSIRKRNWKESAMPCLPACHLVGGLFSLSLPQTINIECNPMMSVCRSFFPSDLLAFSYWNVACRNQISAWSKINYTASRPLSTQPSPPDISNLVQSPLSMSALDFPQLISTIMVLLALLRNREREIDWWPKWDRRSTILWTETDVFGHLFYVVENDNF